LVLLIVHSCTLMLALVSCDGIKRCLHCFCQQVCSASHKTIWALLLFMPHLPSRAFGPGSGCCTACLKADGAWTEVCDLLQFCTLFADP
jgi:hypothetical protein